MKKGERVVVTGMGLISPVGNSPAVFWESLIEKRHSVTPMERFDVSAFRASRVALAVFHPDDHLDPRAARRMNRLSQMAVASARMAVREAAVPSLENAGVFLGTGFGCMETTESYLEKLHAEPPRADPFDFAESVANSPAAHIAIDLQCRGPNAALMNREGSAAVALSHAALAVRSGAIPAALCGGVEETTAHTFNVLDKLRALSTSENPAGPFDAARDGLMPGEGAGAFVVETLAAARNRGADIGGEVLGFGMAHDPKSPASDWPESSDAYVRAMRGALAHANVAPQDVNVVVASANATRRLDAAEARAIAEVFGGHSVHVTSVKGHVGEFAGAGVFSLAAALLMLRSRQVFPIAKFSSPDSTMPALRFTREPEEARASRVLVNGFSSGGSCVSVLLGRAEP